MCIAICQMLSTYMLDFHVCVYIVCICAGGRNVLITQLFILPVCICRHPVLYMYMSYVVNLYVCLSCMCIVCICPGGTVERPHCRVASCSGPEDVLN